MMNTLKCMAMVSVLLLMCNLVLAGHEGHTHDNEMIITLNNQGQLDIHAPAVLHLKPTAQGFWLSDPVCVLSEFDLTNSSLAPVWNISLKRLALTAGLTVLDENGLTDILPADGSEYLLSDRPVWEEEEGWHFHTHIIFAAAEAQPGDEFTATMQMVDSITDNYAGADWQDSSAFAIELHAVPEPASLLLLGGAGLAIVRRRRA